MKKRRLLLSLLGILYFSSTVNAQNWDERPEATYDLYYAQEFNSVVGWDDLSFYGQWNSLSTKVFNENDVSTGALKFKWIEKRAICSKKQYAHPYVFETEMDYSTGSNRGGMVIRIAALSENIQEPVSDPGFNREGIAFYPTTDGSAMIVQFSGVDDGYGSDMNFARIQIPKPDEVTSLLERATLRIEDFGTSIYVFYNDAPYIRIDLYGENGDIYTSGNVYNKNMQVMGSFEGMEIESIGHVAIAQRDAALQLYSVALQYNKNKKVFNPADTVIFESPYRDLYTDSWVATDALGRVLPGYNDVGPVKDDKRRVVGIFYITWHVEGHHTNFQSPYHNDVTKILDTDPAARLDASHPLWTPPSSYHWGEPEMGYFLSKDEYVIRKDMAMLANAGVDVLIMDVTNAVRYWDEWEVLFQTMLKIKEEGNKVPKFCFWAFNGPVITVVQDLYENFYKTERFKELWFHWDNKPLLLYRENPDTVNYKHPNPNYDPDALTNQENPNYGDPYFTKEFYTDYTQEVKDFFTKRNLWWGYYEWQGERYIGTKDNWSFGYQMDDPRVKNMNPDDLVATHNGKKEQAAVTPAQHPSSLVGKSWSRASGEPKLNEYDLPEPTYVPWLDQTVENPEGYGIYFQERWDEAINSDPEFIYINDWNEWNAGKYHDGALRTFMGRENSSYYFVDQYNSEFNRCVQPMKGGYTDNYYMQMVQNIRRYKGVRQHNLNIEVSDRSVDNDFSDWKLDTIEFRDAIGDTRHRKHNGYGGLEYIDTLGRNDIICSKVAYDNDSLYFYVETVRELSSHNVPNWMLLFIDIDRNKGTGWEGYDYIINHSVNSTNQTTLKQWTGLGWENEVPIPYAYNGSEMEIGVSRSSLNLQEDKPEFYFKWADNPKHFNDISGFFAGGESAPDRRFNYNYSATDVLVAEQLPFRELDIPGSIEMEDFDNGGAGIAYADAVYGNSGGAYRANESVDIKEKANNEYYITDIYNNEWLEYTVNVNATGLYSVTIYYIADADNQELSLLMNDSEISSFSFPKTETDDAWSTVQNVVRIKSGTQILKLAADSVLGGVHIDKIVFDKKEVVYPDNGTGLMQTLYNGAIGGRKWFADSICSRIDPTIDHKWIAGESPGCETRSTFWNARWEGWVEAHYSEEYTISLSVNDYGRLWFDGELIIDAWSVGDANKTHDAKINLTANEKKSITIEFANKTEDGSIKMEWESPSQFKEVIPQTQLFPANTTSSVSHMFNKVPVIYPNPATSHVYIRTFSLSKIAVYNYSGQEVYFDEIHSDIHDIDVSLWEPGIYIVKIKGANKVFNQKMLIK